MPLTSNIDAKGKRVRLIHGIIALLAGLLLVLLWAVPTGGTWAWLIALALVAAGGFSIFEARAGWCAVRALGFRTPG
jgi:MFS-type transporter involved in bile tolerance (Atg22 family)